ncbi:MAG: hypothetical protein JXB04_09180 [Kiritimatiellae bacterium]|nr:hypothetical protein [Kiritimatiellia bacterium]
MAGTTKIVVNGQTYNSPDEMPPEVRKVFEESLAHLKHPLPVGEPAKKEHRIVAPGVTVSTTTYGPVASERFVWNGREYDRAEDLPPEARAHFERVRKQLAEGQLKPTGAHNITIKRTDRQTLQFGANGPEMPRSIAGYVVALIVLLLLLAFFLWRYLF